jgi:hypothetical protein
MLSTEVITFISLSVLCYVLYSLSKIELVKKENNFPDQPDLPTSSYDQPSFTQDRG